MFLGQQVETEHSAECFKKGQQVLSAFKSHFIPKRNKAYMEWWNRDFLAGPMIKSPASQSRGPGFDP